MELYQLCSYDDCGLLIYDIRENEEELKEIANTLNKSKKNKEYFVKTLKFETDMYYFIKIMYYKYAKDNIVLKLCHSVCEAIHDNFDSEFLSCRYIKKLDNETVEELKERAMLIAQREFTK